MNHQDNEIIICTYADENTNWEPVEYIGLIIGGTTVDYEYYHIVELDEAPIGHVGNTVMCDRSGNIY